jgi:hypothetical protein
VPAAIHESCGDEAVLFSAVVDSTRNRKRLRGVLERGSGKGTAGLWARPGYQR